MGAPVPNNFKCTDQIAKQQTAKEMWTLKSQDLRNKVRTYVKKKNKNFK